MAGLSLDNTLDVGFADELLTQFDLKRDLLYASNTSTTNNGINERDHKPKLSTNDTIHSVNSNKSGHLSPPMLPPVNQHQTNDDYESSTFKVHQLGVPIATSVPLMFDPITMPSPEVKHNAISNTTLPPSLTSLEQSAEHTSFKQQQHGVSIDSRNVKTKSSPASLPGTITNRSQRRHHHNHNLFRRSSSYLRQKFFSAAADDTTTSPPPLPTMVPDPISITNDDTTYGLEATVTTNHTDNDDIHDHRPRTTSPLSPPPTPPSSSTPIIPSSPSSSPSPHLPLPHPPLTNTTTTTTDATPVKSPCQYPPKPLHYCPVDPPNDRHRASFPIFFPWRKKSFKDPRRQSDPMITSQHIKTRRPFFFL
ncbi:unnamed protein product [Absidia cylindrospora]